MLIKTCNEMNFPRAEVAYVWSIPSAGSCVWCYRCFGDQIGDTAHGGTLNISEMLWGNPKEEDKDSQIMCISNL